MEVNADFAARAVVHGADCPWVPSPMPGVERILLDRLGGEVARATSIVRYAPGSYFSRHEHTGGEEFFVLQGVFQDEHGDYPVGSYVRNPPTSSHTPGSEQGCVIFVKLWQFDLSDRTSVRIDSGSHGFSADALRPGIKVMPLHSDTREKVALEEWAADADIELYHPAGLECLVLNGDFAEPGRNYFPWSWMRLPAGDKLTVRSGRSGCTVWRKSGHLCAMISAPGTT